MCGLKLDENEPLTDGAPVTPHVGVWIETLYESSPSFLHTVTPHVGVWIETTNPMTGNPIGKVTPHVGVWIETWY